MWIKAMVEAVSIKALRPTTISTISNLLNPPKVIPADNGLPRDWSGLAQLVGIDGKLRPHLLQESDKTAQILRLWQSKDKQNATIQNFLQYMEKLDRFDIIDDTTDLIADDINFYTNQSKTVIKPIDLQNDKLILTIDDVTNIEKGLPLQNYDAFVLFDDDDIVVATELIEKLEKGYKLKLCVTERDLVGGNLEFDAATRLITERCNRLIVIISPAFLESEANKFFLKFAQALGMEQRQRKVIPCVFKPINNIPIELSCFHILDYQRVNKFFDFWQKLRDTVRVLPTETNLRTNGDVVQYRGSINLKETETLQPHKESVKFKSDLNLYTQSKDEIISQTPIIASTSSDSLTIAKKENKPKNKKSWKKLLLPLNGKSDKDTPSNNNSNTKSKYKKFFSRYSKKAVAS